MDEQSSCHDGMSFGEIRGTSRSYGQSVSSGTSQAEGHTGSNLHGRARAAREAEVIRVTLQTLAAEISLKDFTWLRLAVDAAFDELLFGPSHE